MVRIFFSGDAIFIDTLMLPVVAGTLVANLQADGNGVERIVVMTTAGLDVIASPAWSDVADASGVVFADGATALAYVQGEFAKRRPVGDLVAVDFAVADGQTVFPLNQPPSLLTTARLEVNGVAYRAPDIAVSAVAVTWAGTFNLSPTDRVIAVYS